jgi:hypothetical protein
VSATVVSLLDIPLFDRVAGHPFVPTCLRRAAERSGGQAWPKATAKRRAASLRAVSTAAVSCSRAGEAVEDGVGVGGVADEGVPVDDGDLAGDQ